MSTATIGSYYVWVNGYMARLVVCTSTDTPVSGVDTFSPVDGDPAGGSVLISDITIDNPDFFTIQSVTPVTNPFAAVPLYTTLRPEMEVWLSIKNIGFDYASEGLYGPFVTNNHGTGLFVPANSPAWLQSPTVPAPPVLPAYNWLLVNDANSRRQLALFVDGVTAVITNAAGQAIP